MKTNTKNRIFSILGALVGAAIGYFYPALVQGFLPVLGIAVGIFYFFASNSVNKNPEKEKVTDFNDYTWFTILRVMMGLLIGGAITSTIVLTMDILEQQKQLGFALKYIM